MFRRFRTIEQNHSPGLQPGQDRRRDQGRVEDDQVIRFVNLVRVVDGLVIVTQESRQRGTGTLRRIDTECLDGKAFLVQGIRQNLGERHAPLATPSVYSDFNHLLASKMASFRPQSKNSWNRGRRY